MLNAFNQPIFVTRPYLPELELFCEGLKEIWKNQWLTNNGPVLRRFTQQLSKYFETNNVCLFNNGTLALQIGLQGMRISGEVITTPFTFVATTHALFWNNIRPVFVDIEPDYYTLDPEKVEAAITLSLLFMYLAIHVNLVVWPILPVAIILSSYMTPLMHLVSKWETNQLLILVI
jgi:dTDP-4-amino-4,6-dideoxygalactose transaminase